MSAVGGSSESTDHSASSLTTHVLGIAIFAITGMQLMSTLDGTIVIVALPRLQAELDLSDAGKSWVITAYVVTFGGLLLVGGRVGDAVGHKRRSCPASASSRSRRWSAAWPPTASP